MKLFRRISAFSLVLALLLSMSISVFAADVENLEQLREALSNTENTDVNLTATIDAEGAAVQANGATYNITGSGSLVDVQFGGSGTVNIGTENNEMNVQDIVATDTVNVTVTGDVSNSIDANGNANVTVNGDVSSEWSYEKGAVNATDHATITINGNITSEGDNHYNYGDGVHADGNASVTVNGTINAEDHGVFASSEAQVTVNNDITAGYSGVIAYEDATVTVTGNVDGDENGIDAAGNANVTANGDVMGGKYGIRALDNTTVSVNGNVTGADRTEDESMSGIGVGMLNSATVTVTGNVTAGNASGDNCFGAPGLLIEAASTENIGSVTIYGDVRSGDATGEDPTQFPDIYIGILDGAELPEMTIGSYETIGASRFDEEDGELTEEELDAIKGSIKAPPTEGGEGSKIPEKGESVQVVDNFWNNMVRKIRKAQPGEEVKVNLHGYTRIPKFVIKAALDAKVTLIVQWNGGEDLTVPSDIALDFGDYLPLKTLAEMQKK